MGFYSSWYIVCHVRPEYVSAVKHFTENLEWHSPIPAFIAEWQHFLEKVGRTDVIYVYDYVPPYGCDNSCWGSTNEMSDKHIWTMAGSTKNYNSEIGVFLTRVLPHLSDDIQLCLLTNESREEARNSHNRLFPNDTIDDDKWYTSYTDSQLRKADYRDISI